MSSTNQPSTPGSTSNPAFSGKSFQRAVAAMPQTQPMTVAGAVNRSILLIAITGAVAWVTGSSTLESFQNIPGGAPWVVPAMIGSAIAGFIVALITIFKPNVSHITAPLYAVLEGAFVGIISAYYGMQFSGIVPQAVGATFAVFFVMLILYRARIIKVTERFRMIIIGATAGIFVFYIVSLVVGLFGVDTSALFVSGPLAIGISVVIVLVAALNLALDFDFIEAGASAHAPARMEWYAAFGLLVTLIWLYLEILRLLAITRR
jgi:uncharacterized YccA/Bax inhibitor family protein